MRISISRRFLLALGAATLAAISCHTVPDHAHDGHGVHHGAVGHTKAPAAHATIEGRSGSSLRGTADFRQVAGGVEIRVHVHDAPPGWHAVHIHEKGDCSSADGKSAGGHFNPGGMDHGSPHAAVHHAGDLGNMWVGEDGIGHHLVLMPELTVVEGDHSVRGRGIIVHAGIDDLMTQPTGAAGGRIGCGVIL